MDYDENDFQCQNFHLVGEDNNKFPPSLHPFPLPKYDLDENLQVHIGFANLIETEGLEGNNWIENFSPGGSAIEFSSSAAESCSISRRNNVWSEATSSESVEMLLKSVGEDEMIDQKAITKKVDVHNELNDMDGHKDTSLKQTESGSSKVLDMIQINQAVPPDKCQNILSGLDGDTVEVEPKIEGMLQTSIDDKCRIEMKISASGGQLSAEGKIVTDECITENRIPASSDYEIRDSSVIADAILEKDKNDNPVQIAFVKPHGCFSTPLAAEKGEYTCQDEPSSGSICNLVTSPERSTTRTPLKQLKECSKIDIIDNSGILSDDAQKESCCIRDSEMIDQTSQSFAVPSGICRVKDSSLLEQAVVSLNDKCSDTGISEDPDGLFGAITDQTKALVKESQTTDAGLPLTMERSLMEVEINSVKESTEISNEVAQAFHLTEEQVTNTGYTGVEQLRKIDATHAENTLSIESLDRVDSKEEQELDGLLEPNEEKQVPEVQLTKNNNSDVENIGIVELHSSTDISCEMATKERNNDHDLGFSQLNHSPGNSDLIGIAEYAEDEVAKNITKESIVELNDQKDDTLEECTSAEDAVIPYAVCSKSSEKCDADTLVIEPDEVCIASESTISAKEDSMPFTNLTQVNNDALIVTKEKEGAPATERRTAITANMDILPLKIVQSEPVVADMPTKDGDDEQTAEEFPAYVLEKKVAESSESIILKIDLDSQVSRESIIMSHPVLMDCASATVRTEPVVELVAINDSENIHQSEYEDIHQSEYEDTASMDVVERQQEEVGTGSPRSHSIHLDEKEIQISGISSLPVSMDISDAKVSSAPVIQANLCEHSPAPFTDVEPSAGRSSSYVDVSADVACQDKLQSFLEHPAMDEHDTHLEEDLVSHASPDKENDGVDASGAFPGEDMGITLITSGNCTGNAPESAVTRSNAESHMVEAESAYQSSFDHTCGSPTVISCSKDSQVQMHHEGNKGQQEQVDPVSDDPLVETSDTRMNNDKVGCSGLNLKEDGSTEVDKSFTFEVGSVSDISGKDTDKESTPFSSKQTSELPQMSEKFPDEHPQESKEDELHGICKKTPYEHKTTHISGHSTDALSTSQTEVSKQTTIPKQTSEMDVDPCGTSAASTGTISGSRDLEEPQYYHCSPTVMASADLSSSVPAVALFHQPFTDLQQIQLRAQIFVYGSLIQGIPPDEACMISAFGEADGSRSLWEGLWRISAERYQNQKSPFSSCETPLHSYPGLQGTSAGLQNKAPSTSARSACKTSSVPPWNSSAHDGSHSSIPMVTHLDFNQALSPVHTRQSSQIRQYAGNSPWQTPHPGPWVIQSSTHDTAAQFSTLSVTETVQVTPVGDSSIPSSVGTQFVSPHCLLPATGATNISPASVVQIEAQKKATTPVNSKIAPGKKLRKRKKGAPPEELQSNNLASQPLADAPATASVSKHLLASSLLPKPANPPIKVTSNGLVSATTHIISPTHYKILSGDTEQRAIFSEETCTKVELAKLQAEDAAALAASAVRHSQGIWTQLAIQRKTGLISEADEKLASAAAAAAAAASVAKAAAAAAKVASDAALQAKMMADEAVSSVRTGNLTHISESGLLDMGNSLIRLTPGSILKGKDKVHGSSTIISAAREAARRRVEAASAATKRAENLDAIVKAAELAAEAVSQAGTIITMGEPLPFTLNDLVEAGPEGHWRVRRSITSGHAKTNGLHNEKHMSLDNTGSSDKSVEQFQAQPANNRIPHNSSEKERTVSSSKHPILLEEHCLGNGSNTALSAVPADGNERDHSTINHNEFSIQEGSLVEVASDDGEMAGIWFSANVLEVKDGKAYVCYTDLLSNEGNGKLKKWVSLEGEGNRHPKIRLAHPMTTAKYEGIRKRRRAALGNYVWAVGDQVDAWMHDGWREGIITEKSQGDDTKLTVHFPDGGDASVIRAWNLRSSLVWKDGQWVEWSRPKESSHQPGEGDTPNEKRQKTDGADTLVDPTVDGKGVGKMLKNLPTGDSGKSEESRQLVLSAKDKVFSVGKSTKGDVKSDARNIRRIGSQKEGSRVVIGVPKPGKKRKFMEVSKHYVADKTDKTSEGSDSIKFAKYLMPQASRVWRNTPKVDPKGKSVGDSKIRGLKAVKPSMQTRRTSEKNSSMTFASTVETGHIPLSNARAPFSTEPNNLEKKSLDVGSYASRVGKPGSPRVEPIAQPASNSSKKKSSSAVDVDVGLRGKLTPVVEKSTRGSESSENLGKAVSDAPEPRRSNRRIQPTSRLLEGLQSSLIISKIPSFSHDKGAKVQHKGASSSRGSAHG